MVNIRSTLRFVPALLIALFLAGCLGTASLTGPKGSGTGTLAVWLTDAPSDEIKEVWVTITGVQAHRNGRWEVISDLFDEPIAVNLLELRFDEKLLGESLIPAGSYSQLRLIVDDSDAAKSYVLLDDDTLEYLKVPSGAQTGLKIHHAFIVPSDGAVTLLLDVNVVDFIHRAGNSGKYMMNPNAIRVVDRVTAGKIAGTIHGEGAEGEEPDVITDRSLTVNVLQGDELIAQTVVLAEDHGRFQVNGLPQGAYTVTVEPGKGDSLVEFERIVIDDVVVIAGETTELNDGQPIVLPRAAVEDDSPGDDGDPGDDDEQVDDDDPVDDDGPGEDTEG